MSDSTAYTGTVTGGWSPDVDVTAGVSMGTGDYWYLCVSGGHDFQQVLPYTVGQLFCRKCGDTKELKQAMKPQRRRR